PIELHGEDLAVKVITLASQFARHCIPDLLRTVITSGDHKRAIGRECHSVDRLSYLAQTPDPRAARDRPDRCLPTGAPHQKAWPVRVPAQTIDTGSRKGPSLCPAPYVKDTHVIATTRCQPVAISAECHAERPHRIIA